MMVDYIKASKNLKDTLVYYNPEYKKYEGYEIMRQISKRYGLSPAQIKEDDAEIMLYYYLAGD